MSDEKSFEDALHAERQGADAGLNPMFGEWQQHFEFPPVPYGSGAAQRGSFREAIQSKLANKWLYSNEISISITLHVDAQTTLETDEYADLDNYAKAILDGLKGPKGIMFDDTQVQSLAIHWIDGYGASTFAVEAKAFPDEFVLKPQEFYEMPDGLWYPHGRYLWSQGGTAPVTDKSHFAGLSIMELMSSTKRRVRAALRRAGADRLRAYQQTHYLSSQARGFHRSRVEEFPMRTLRSWRAQRAEWKKNNSGALVDIDATLQKMRETHDELIASLVRLGVPRS